MQAGIVCEKTNCFSPRRAKLANIDANCVFSWRLLAWGKVKAPKNGRVWIFKRKLDAKAATHANHPDAKRGKRVRRVD